MNLTIILLFLPLLLGALLNGIAGAKFKKSVSALIGVGAIAAAFAGALTIIPAVNGGNVDDQAVWTWISAGGLTVQAAFKFDSLSMIMALIVTGVSLLIHIYAVGYMNHEDERGFSRFFAYLNLFVFSMLILVMGNSFLLMFVGWEGVGLCSYLLIGFWYDRERKEGDSTWPAEAAKKAFIVNRIGDFGFLIGMFILIATFGSLNFDAVFDAAKGAPDAPLFLGQTPLWWACAALFLGAVGKSAQIPLHVWLPDAMQGPTPVSALIHAATMVTAGVYMVARSHVLFDLSGAGGIVAWVGIATALFAATMAVASFDFKGVLAYSTISQLGYMIAAVGMGAYAAGMAHLMTHAFFKALLFLAAGSVLHALHDVGDIRRMGGLRGKMRTTCWTFFAAALAISGFPLLSGFFSKDAILVYAYEHNMAIFAIGAVTAGLTAFYMFRLFSIVFMGESRDKDLTEHAHESPPVMTIPLIVLAALSVVGGFAFLGFGESGPFYKTLESVFHAEHHAASFFNPAMLIGTALGLVGIAAGYFMYKDKSAEDLQRANALVQLWRNKYWVDELYDRAVVRPLKWLSSSALWRVIDKGLIDGAVNVAGALMNAAGSILRFTQNGMIQTYAAVIFAGAVLLVLIRLL